MIRMRIAYDIVDLTCRFQLLFGVDLARKDAKHALDVAKTSGVRMRDVEVAGRHLAIVQ